MGVEFSCPTLILLLVAALPAPWNGADSAAVAVDGSADSNGAATPAAASLRVSRRLRGVFIEQPPGWGALMVVAPPSPSKGLGAVRVPPPARLLRISVAVRLMYGMPLAASRVNACSSS